MKIFILIFVVAALAAVGYGVLHKQAQPQAVTETESEAPQVSLREINFAKTDPLYRFSAKVPQELEIGSDIFLTTFRASEFLTLKTVTIHRKEQTTIQGHPAVMYEIEKKADAPIFSNQPSWRNERHTAVDIRFSRNNPTIFYSFAFRPGLEQSTIDSFLDSLVFHNDRESISFPLSEFEKRVVKKPFGLYITPQTSPVEPEFFTGFHTAIDYEIFPEEETISVPVYAMCGGELKVARSASGYGGVAVQECLLEDTPVTVIYGHVAVSSLKETPGTYVSPGEIIGSLGMAGGEAGGGRKHLHFSIRKGESIDIRGYVQTESELEYWLDPASLF